MNLNSMLINFAHDGLVSIECDSLEFDGHGVKNLIAVDKSRRTKGFLADRFIKPPTNISLLFKCDVDISRIVLNPRVGGQKSAGFEVLKVFRNKSTISLAQTVIKDGAEVVLFCRSEGTTEAVRFCSERAADRVREIRLRIFKTSGSTVPALGGLDVWGKPSQNVPQPVRNEVVSTWTSICQPITVKTITKEEQPAPKSSLLSVLSNADIIIPEEFIDPISCEIMTIPMTLPSGNIVDVSTLEKFNEAQVKLGRPIGCDPFTGVLFTEKNRPVFATALKSRLDKFLLDNSEAPAIKTIPRTLGRKSNSLVESSTYSSSSCSVTTSKRTSGVSERSNIQTVDDLLVDCLDGLPSYVDTAPQPKKARIGCVRCSKPACPGENEYFYKLPCQDLLCRGCLFSMKTLKDNQCAECSKQFDFSGVVRHHVESLSTWKLPV